ncbi:MAG: hypothetical protein U9R08_04200 [Nanoarchaeota archaeon]|nr:hypothetical protein [Nanoarchaeota archaeon]
MKKEELSKYIKKYNLPEFKNLNDEFEIGKIDTKQGFYFKDIARAINNKIGYFAGLLEPAINPPIPTIHSMVETNNIEKNDKETILQLYKKLLYLAHKGYTLETFAKEKDITKFINEIWNQWQNIKKDMKICMDIITKSWIKEQKQENIKLSYTG